jgi:anti-sigma regulatory factor (Ser/Thr protein kinase)
MATAAYGVLDPETGQLTLATAGHLPPAVISAGGARLVDIEPTTPLGAMSFGHRPELETQLDHGETLVMYTDGLVERSGVPLTDSIEVLLKTIAPARTAEEACQLAVELVPLEGLKDDMAVVALQNTEIPEVLELFPAARPSELAEIRRNIRRWLRMRGASGEEITEITLAANEACANAVEHAYSPAPAQFSFVASEQDGLITITVTDRGSWRQPRGVDRGRGLRIMDAAMDSVEVREAEQGGTQITMTRQLNS